MYAVTLLLQVLATHIFVHAIVLQQQETVYLPELLHNITLLVEKTEHEIVTGDKKYAITL